MWGVRKGGFVHRIRAVGAEIIQISHVKGAEESCAQDMRGVKASLTCMGNCMARAMTSAYTTLWQKSGLWWLMLPENVRGEIARTKEIDENTQGKLVYRILRYLCPCVPADVVSMHSQYVVSTFNQTKKDVAKGDRALPTVNAPAPLRFKPGTLRVCGTTHNPIVEVALRTADLCSWATDGWAKHEKNEKKAEKGEKAPCLQQTHYTKQKNADGKDIEVPVTFVPLRGKDGCVTVQFRCSVSGKKDHRIWGSVLKDQEEATKLAQQVVGDEQAEALLRFLVPGRVDLLHSLLFSSDARKLPAKAPIRSWVDAVEPPENRGKKKTLKSSGKLLDTQVSGKDFSRLILKLATRCEARDAQIVLQGAQGGKRQWMIRLGYREPLIVTPKKNGLMAALVFSLSDAMFMVSQEGKQFCRENGEPVQRQQRKFEAMGGMPAEELDALLETPEATKWIMSRQREFEQLRWDIQKGMRDAPKGARGHGRARRYRDVGAVRGRQRAWTVWLCRRMVERARRWTREQGINSVCVGEWNVGVQVPGLEKEQRRRMLSLPRGLIRNLFASVLQEDGVTVERMPEAALKCPICGEKLPWTPNRMTSCTGKLPDGEICGFREHRDYLRCMLLLDARGADTSRARKAWEDKNSLRHSVRKNRQRRQLRGKAA